MWKPYEDTIDFFYLSLLLPICPFDLVLSSEHLHCKNRMYCKLNINFEVRNYQRGSFMVWEINMGVCPRLEFDNIMFINCLEYDFYIYGAFEFLCNSIANL